MELPGSMNPDGQHPFNVRGPAGTRHPREIGGLASRLGFQDEVAAQKQTLLQRIDHRVLVEESHMDLRKHAEQSRIHLIQMDEDRAGLGHP